MNKNLSETRLYSPRKIPYFEKLIVSEIIGEYVCKLEKDI